MTRIPTLPPLPSTIANLPDPPQALSGNEFTAIVQNGVTYRATAFSLTNTGVQSVVSGTGITVTTLNHVATVSLNVPVTAAHGGTGLDTSASTGVAQVLSGVWSISTDLENGTTATTQSASDDSTNVATTAFVNNFVGANTRTRLATATTYYVATTGNDSNPGTIGSPWLTIQHAVNVIEQSLDLNGFTVTVQIADGTYAGFAFTTVLVGGKNTSILINGNSVTPSNVLISSGSTGTIVCENGALGATIENLKITNSVGYGIFVTGGEIGLGTGIVFGACAAGHMFAVDIGIISPESSYTISGNAVVHFKALNGGLIDVGALITITLTGTPAFSSAFALVDGSGSNLFFESNAGVATFSGPATGVRYVVSNNGVINTQGSGATYLPGDSGGSGTNSGTSPFGLYV